MKEVGETEAPKAGRKPKVQIALRPSLAQAIRHISRKERRQLSDVFQEMLELWLRVKRPKKYSEIEIHDEE